MEGSPVIGTAAMLHDHDPSQGYAERIRSAPKRHVSAR